LTIGKVLLSVPARITPLLTPDSCFVV
jgi:hypothetical protein